jgi:Leucine-rich repeat (LRR) protein
MRQLKLFTAVITLALVGAMVVGWGPKSVTFPDENLEAAIRYALNKPVGEKIMATELAKLTTLMAESSGIADLSGLEYCTSLTVLDLGNN